MTEFTSPLSRIQDYLEKRAVLKQHDQSIHIIHTFDGTAELTATDLEMVLALAMYAMDQVPKFKAIAAPPDKKEIFHQGWWEYVTATLAGADHRYSSSNQDKERLNGFLSAQALYDGNGGPW